MNYTQFKEELSKIEKTIQDNEKALQESHQLREKFLLEHLGVNPRGQVSIEAVGSLVSRVVEMMNKETK